MTNAQKVALKRETARLQRLTQTHPETKLSLIFGEMMALSNKKSMPKAFKAQLSYLSATGIIELSRLCKLIRGTK